MNFGDNLKNLRKQKNLSQEELAEKVRVSRQSVSKWECGEAYPEMNNLLELCRIFHCKINDLVNDSILDVDALDEEVKQEIITLKESDQKKMKGLSKFISILAKIGRIACLIAIPLLFITIILTPFFISHLEVEDQKIYFRSDKEKIEVVQENDKISVKINGVTVADEKNENLNTKIVDLLTNNSKTLICVYIEIGFITLLITLYIMNLVLKYLGKLFTNFNEGITPFTLENVYLIKKMAWFMIVVIILPNIGGALFSIILGPTVSFDFEMFDLVEILFLFSLSYIFEYGRLIESNKKGKFYE